MRGWQKPFAEPGFAFGGNSGVFAESPDRIFIAQRGEFRLPTPLPPEYAGFAGSIKMNVLSLVDRRVWRNCLYTLDRNGKVKERWTQWDHLCEGSSGPGPHRIRISPYDRDRRVWVINETFNTIYVFSNDGKQLLKTLGEKNVPGSDATHFAKPQDVAFLPDGRILIADGLDNHRVMILDRDLNYLGEFGGNGKGPGQFSGVHAIAVGPERPHLRARSIGRPHQRLPDDGRSEEGRVRDAFPGFSLPLDIIVNDDSLWMTDLKPLRFVKLDFKGNRLYTWMVPPRPAGWLPRGAHLLGRFGRQPLRRRQPVRPHAEVRAEAGRRSRAVDPRAVGGEEVVSASSGCHWRRSCCSKSSQGTRVARARDGHGRRLSAGHRRTADHHFKLGPRSRGDDSAAREGSRSGQHERKADRVPTARTGDRIGHDGHLRRGLDEERPGNCVAGLRQPEVVTGAVAPRSSHVD